MSLSLVILVLLVVKAILSSWNFTILTRKRKEMMYRIWQHMDTQLKVLKKKSKNASYYAQIVTEKKPPSNRIGTHTNKGKGAKRGKSNRYGERYYQVKTRSKKSQRRITRNIKWGKKRWKEKNQRQRKFKQ